MLHRLTNATLFALVIFTTACAVPLGPGFHTEKELLEVRFVPGSPPHLEVRATFTLKNTGNAPLDALELSLPDETYFGRQNLRITVEGASVSPQPIAVPSSGAAADPPQSSFRISFASPWPQKARRTFVVAYDLSRTSAGGTILALAGNSFSLPTAAWYPLVRAPKGLFAEGNRRPARIDLSVRVPDGFLVHAAGHPRGKKRRAAESEFRFRIAPEDFSPFVLAGRYHEQQFKDSRVVITVWSFQPVAADQFAGVGPRLAASAQILEKLFGPIQTGKRSYPLWIVETPFPSLKEFSSIQVVQWGLAPAAALLSSSAFGYGVGSGDFLNLVERAWASTWPHHVARPAPGVDEILGDALSGYADMVADQARRGNPARLLYVGGFLNSYDAACHERKEIPVALLEPKESGMQRRIAEDKVALFLLAAENEVGAETLHHALRRMIQGLRGRTYSFSDFRVALEAESGKDLGECFRLWLNHPGIPAAFRQKYERNENRK